MPAQADAEMGFAAKAREAKRAQAIALGIDEQFIGWLVETFYSKIRDDALLGPIFERHISDWPKHLEQMKRFWRSILHNSGEFNGSPMRKHIAIGGLEQAHFAHWLELFYATLRESDVPVAIEPVGNKARMIAQSLMMGIQVHDGLIPTAANEKELPHV